MNTGLLTLTGLSAGRTAPPKRDLQAEYDALMSRGRPSDAELDAEFRAAAALPYEGPPRLDPRDRLVAPQLFPGTEEGAYAIARRMHQAETAPLYRIADRALADHAFIAQAPRALWEGIQGVPEGIGRVFGNFASGIAKGLGIDRTILYAGGALLLLALLTRR